MPKTKFQEVIFTIIMVFFMVYAMICYNTALNIGEMKNEVFLSAFKELSFMGPIAFILDFFIIGHIAKKLAFKIVNPAKDNPFFLVLAISAISVIFMCPLMSLAATLIFKMRVLRLFRYGLKLPHSTSLWHFAGSCFLQARLSDSFSDIFSEGHLQQTTHIDYTITNKNALYRLIWYRAFLFLHDF